MNRVGFAFTKRLFPSGRSLLAEPICYIHHFGYKLCADGICTSGLQLKPANRTRLEISRGFRTDLQTRRPRESSVEKTAAVVKEFSEIPGPTSLPVIGSFLSIYFHKDFKSSTRHKIWQSLFDEYGPIGKIVAPGSPTLVFTRNADDVETFYKNTLENPTRHAFSYMKKIRDEAQNNYFQKRAGLIPENGEEWWRLRSRVQGPLMRPKDVSAYLSKVDRATLAYMDRIPRLQSGTGHVPDDFVKDLSLWTLECVGLIALDKELGSLDSDLSEDSDAMKMIRLVGGITHHMIELEMMIPFWKFFRTPVYIKLETIHNTFIEMADKVIEEVSRKLDEANGKDGTNQTPSILETFLKTDGLSKSDVATMVCDMLGAGVETTTTAVIYSLYALATNPDVQRKLQQEVDSVMGEDEELLDHHITEMTYLHNFVKETLRMYPLALEYFRFLTDDIVMSGYKVPAGSAAIGIATVLTRDEKYFTRPNDFLPERWARDRPYGPIHPYASLPFAHGKRMCVGKRIAEQQMYTFLIRAMQRYTVIIESPHEMELESHFVMKPAIPLPFQFHSRK